MNVRRWVQDSFLPYALLKVVGVEFPAWSCAIRLSGSDGGCVGFSRVAH